MNLRRYAHSMLRRGTTDARRTHGDYACFMLDRFRLLPARLTFATLQSLLYRAQDERGRRLRNKGGCSTTDVTTQ